MTSRAGEDLVPTAFWAEILLNAPQITPWPCWALQDPRRDPEGTPKGVLEIAGENLIRRIVSPRYWERLKGDAAAFLQYS